MVFVKESATSDVSNESIEPNTASVTAIDIIIFKSAKWNTGIINFGKLTGISPIVETFNPNPEEIIVPATRAIRGGGTLVASFLGVKNTIKSEIQPNIKLG